MASAAASPHRFRSVQNAPLTSSSDTYAYYSSGRGDQGQPALHDVCKEVVDKLPENDSRLNEIEVILESTGVISGQFGFVEAYQRKKDEISPWLSDPRPKVRAFAERGQHVIPFVDVPEHSSVVP
jgi:hypothetical protein